LSLDRRGLGALLHAGRVGSRALLRSVLRTPTRYRARHGRLSRTRGRKLPAAGRSRITPQLRRLSRPIRRGVWWAGTGCCRLYDRTLGQICSRIRVLARIGWPNRPDSRRGGVSRRVSTKRNRFWRHISCGAKLRSSCTLAQPCTARTRVALFSVGSVHDCCGQTLVRAAHVTELRAAVEALEAVLP